MVSKKEESGLCCDPIDDDMGCCRVESVVTVDERGQMVLPKEVRDKAKIKAGDKLALVSWGKTDEVFCLTLVKSQDFEGMVKDFLGPMMKDIFSQ